MSKLRLIPKLLLKTSKFDSTKLVLVVSKQFSSFTEIGDPVSQSKIFQDQMADELLFLNIDSKNIDTLANIVSEVSKEIFMPLTVGGGVKTLEDFRLLLSSGADKILVNTESILNPNLINIASSKFGSQCVVVGIDYKLHSDGKNVVYRSNGKIKTDLILEDWILEVVERGAGEIVLTSIDRDGMCEGLDLELFSSLANKVSIPIVASGGCGVAKHFIDGFQIGEVNAVSAGTFFAHRDQNFIQTRSQIYNSGINIRKSN
jgi:cyclase